MKNHSASPPPAALPSVVPAPGAPTAEGDKEFFHHATEPNPSMPVDPNGRPLAVSMSGGVAPSIENDSKGVPPAPTTEQEIAAREAAAGGAPVVTEIAPVAVQPERVAGDGPEVEHRDGGKFVAGTHIVVGGPTQQ